MIDVKEIFFPPSPDRYRRVRVHKLREREEREVGEKEGKGEEG